MLNLLLNLVVIYVTSTTLALADSEVRLRNATERSVSNCVELGGQAGYQFRANCSGWNFRKGRKYYVRYNSLGLRGPNYKSKKSPRVLLVGPSILVGPGLDEKDLPTSVAEKELRKKYRSAEVINGATEGYMAIQSSIRLPEYIRSLKPDLVVYQFTLGPGPLVDQILRRQRSVNDFNRLSYSPTEIVSPKTYALAKRFGIEADILTIVAAVKRLEISLKIRMSRDKRKNAETFLSASLNGLQVIQEVCQKFGTPLLVVYQDEPLSNRMNLSSSMNFSLFSRFDIFTPAVYQSEHFLEEILKKKNIAVEKLNFSYFTQKTEDVTLNDDYHLNEAGAKLLGKEIARAVEKKLAKVNWPNQRSKPLQKR